MRDVAKGNFKNKLESIYKALCMYIDERSANEFIPHTEDIKLRYAIILLAVYDLHHGTFENQADAIQYFQSDEFERHKNGSLIPAAILDRIIHDTQSYAAYITYQEDSIDESTWI